VIGLAVPVTASYIIAVVIAAPALIQLGVPDFAAHMFVFYYAVLSEVSPPTALSCFAAAALTGGNPYKTTMYAWKYTAAAFIVPFMFILHPSGLALLLKGSSVLEGAWVILTSFAGIFALSAAASGWLLKKTGIVERIILATGALMLVYPAFWADAAGLVLVAIVYMKQKLQLKTSAA
jgi:TRAP-type uncharacterized transport system fused permease subunit